MFCLLVAVKRQSANQPNLFHTDVTTFRGVNISCINILLDSNMFQPQRHQREQLVITEIWCEHSASASQKVTCTSSGHSAAAASVKQLLFSTLSAVEMLHDSVLYKCTKLQFIHVHVPTATCRKFCIWNSENYEWWYYLSSALPLSTCLRKIDRLKKSQSVIFCTFAQKSALNGLSPNLLCGVFPWT